MANKPAQLLPQRQRRGTVLTAAEMNRIRDALIRRIDGGKGINIRAFGGRIIIEASDV